MGYFILIIVLYYLGKFFIRFVWPVAKMVYATNKQMKRMRNQAHSTQQQQYGNTVEHKTGSTQKGDYIDFVEVK